MSQFIARRAIQAVAAFFVITLLTFVIMRTAPGDPLTLLLSESNLSPENIRILRESYGLDQPVPIQFIKWLGHLLTGDFGTSLIYGQPVLGILWQPLLNTLLLSVVTLLFSLVVGICLGIYVALRRGSYVDHLVRIVSVSGHAVPDFWFGLTFILFFGVTLRWLPVGGMQSLGASSWDMTDRLLHLIGPVLALSLGPIATITRLMRTEMLDVFSQDYVRTARAKGLNEGTVIFRHALPNALTPIITNLGSRFALLLSGTVVIEQIFAWPGMGRLTFEAASARDYPIMMAAVAVASIMLLISYLIRDVLYRVVDPRMGRA